MVIRVLIADDQTLFRNMLEGILKMDESIEIVATAANGQEAVQLAMEHKPDIVLLDIQMPEKNGVEALEEIKEHLTGTKVVMLTTFEDIESITASYFGGADGYLVKDMEPDILIMAIKCIHHDIVLMHKSAYSIISSTKGSMITNTKKYVKFGNITFDRIDIMIIRQIAEGRTNREIAALLNYSEGTIKNRVSNILSMTGLSDRTQISVFALKNNII